MSLSPAQRESLEALTRQKPVVLFMKGNRQFPQCGFSATVVGILDRVTSGYATVNILSDPAVREGMKELSSWPTFPQLYVRGELVGGCDIVKAMYASGELQKLLEGIAPAPAAPKAGSLSLTVTPAAARALNEAVAGAEGEVVRLDIGPDFACDLHVAPAEPGDVEVTSNGVRVFVTAPSAARAQGVTIDLVTGPAGAAFKIDNPNAPPQVSGLSAAAAKARLDAGTLELFDVRPAAERAVASIPGARPLDGADLDAMRRDAPIILHCHHGVRSRAAGEQLLRRGFTQVFNLEGGIDAWSRDVDPSVPRY